MPKTLAPLAPPPADVHIATCLHVPTKKLATRGEARAAANSLRRRLSGRWDVRCCPCCGHHFAVQLTRRGGNAGGR